MPAARIISMILLALVMGRPALTDDVPTQSIRDVLEGTWVFEEWNVDGMKLAPPEATGRLSLHDNVIIIVLLRSRFEHTKSYVGFGNYAVSDSAWSYGYDRYAILDETPSRVTVDHELQWSGLRSFQARVEGQKLVFEYEALVSANLAERLKDHERLAREILVKGREKIDQLRCLRRGPASTGKSGSKELARIYPQASSNLTERID